MTIANYLLITLIMLTTIFKSEAQKKPYYNEQEQVIEAAYTVLDHEMNSGNLISWARENNFKGSYIFDITIGGKKGEVLTVFAVQNNGVISNQNKLNSYLKSMRFPFKMPKDKRYKFRYEFKF